MVNSLILLTLFFSFNVLAQTKKVSYASASSKPNWKCQCQNKPDASGVSGIISDMGSKSKSYLRMPKNARKVDKFLYELDMSSMPGFKGHWTKILNDPGSPQGLKNTARSKLQGSASTFYITHKNICKKMKNEFVKVSRKQTIETYKNCTDMYKKLSN
tara:strand:- start:286 stop:759 length:474 start_codon:yes stop_codon:yes gene_type:complete